MLLTLRGEFTLEARERRRRARQRMRADRELAQWFRAGAVGPETVLRRRSRTACASACSRRRSSFWGRCSTGRREALMFLRNAWYVAAWDHEVSSDKLFSRIVLNEPLVLYRCGAGRVVALEDRCCHRHYPLHKGKLVNDCIQCHYHGFTYDGLGACVRIPGQSHVPDSARVRSYPAVQRHRFVWVWMGDPALAD